MGQFDGLPKTTSLKLNKPGYDNVADIEALNENADILDTEISKIKGKYVSSVNGKTGDVTIEKYTHPNSGVNAGTYRKVTVNAQGHVTIGVDGAVPITEGGTGATTVAGARNALGLGNTSGAVPIANGGTGATNASQARTNLGIDNLDLTPVGDVVYRPYLRAGYVKANGATVNRADYPNLVKFATDNNLWTDSPSTEPWKYGRGNGSTTMVLPDYRNRFIQGGDNVVTKAAGLPQVNLTTAEAVQVQDGTVAARTAILETPNNGYGAVTNGTGFSKSAGVGLNISGNYSISNALTLVAKNAIYGNSSTVQPPAIILIPQLRY